MPEQEHEYEQYAPPSDGRLFSSAMFGFNKQEVLEYLEELTDEHYQRQGIAEMRVQELNARVKELEEAAASAPPPQQDDAALLDLQHKLTELVNELDISRAATVQAEEELAQLRATMAQVQEENTLLREEDQRLVQQLTELKNSPAAVAGYQDDGRAAALEDENADLRAEADALRQQLDALRVQLAEANDRLSEEDDTLDSARRSATAIIAEANAEAERIRDEGRADRERIHRQIRHSAGNLAESIANLRSDISGVEGDVGEILESVQLSLGDVLNSLGRTEQSLSSFGLQIDRFPSASPPVPRPIPRESYPRESAPRPVVKRSPTSGSGFRRLGSAADEADYAPNLRVFRPSYSSDATAPSYDALEDSDPDERLRNLSETLVDTLRQMMN